jgi:uncharacterized membrane protein
MPRIKYILKLIFATFFVLAGVNHFIHTGFYLWIMPAYLPSPLFLIYLSGAFEILLGALLLVRRLTHVAAWGLIALLIAVFPANLHMATNHALSPEYRAVLLWVRLPLQGVLIAWAYWYTLPDSLGTKRPIN